MSTRVLLSVFPDLDQLAVTLVAALQSFPLHTLDMRIFQGRSMPVQPAWTC